MSVLTLIPAASDPFDAAEADVRARYVAAYLADDRAGDVIARDWTLYEIEMYDAANPDQPPLMDEIDALDTPAAA
ncbi:hypothetical protein AB0D78_28285 [Streptomyces avermitilis]|uniref:hypothetical protein n=1 Tax=Streptomyces avermitilis TaxID=33903 RepID=UPI003402A14F